MNTSYQSPQALLRQIAFVVVLIPLVLTLTLPFSPLAHGSALQSSTSAVRVNQTGYLPNLPKRATIVNASTSPLTWQLKNSSGSVMASGTTTVFGNDAASGDYVHIADFSSYTTSGTGYTLVVGTDVSHPFNISTTLYHKLKYDALSYYYHTRSGIAITMPYADDVKWTRPAGHIGVAPNQGDLAVETEERVAGRQNRQNRQAIALSVTGTAVRVLSPTGDPGKRAGVAAGGGDAESRTPTVRRS